MPRIERTEEQSFRSRCRAFDRCRFDGSWPRIWTRPRLSGRSTRTWRSKRPARSNAGSRISGRLVAASTTRPTLGSNPSISEGSWFTRLLFLVFAPDLRRRAARPAEATVGGPVASRRSSRSARSPAPSRGATSAAWNATVSTGKPAAGI